MDNYEPTPATQTIIPSEERLREHLSVNGWSAMKSLSADEVNALVAAELERRTSSAVPAVGEAVAWRVEHGGGATFWNVEANAVSNAKATGGTVQPLYTHPLPSTEPSEAMVEAALDAKQSAFYGVPSGRIPDDRDRMEMRAALRAALNESQSK